MVEAEPLSVWTWRKMRAQLPPRAPVRPCVDAPQAFDVSEQSFDPLVGLGQKFTQQLVVHHTRL